MSGMTDRDIGRKHNKDRRQVLRTITKAKERAERDNRPLLDIQNVQETPGKWGRKRKFTDMEKENIVSNVTSTHEKRVKTAHQWVKDLDLDCSDTTFTRITVLGNINPGTPNYQLNYQHNQTSYKSTTIYFSAPPIIID